MKNLSNLQQANEVLETFIPYVLAINAGIVMYNFFKAQVYNRQSQQLRRKKRTIWEIAGFLY
ncbi:MAG: hypothetical protein MI921_27985 [Cytophagales bacterium]|nr:hypothetical protein [Cytophagales bacterium]